MMPGQPVDPNVWEDTLIRLMESIAELPACWRDQSRPHVDALTNAIVLLHVPLSAAVGHDETRIEVDETKLTSDPPEEMRPTQCGVRRTVLQVSVESYDQDAPRRAGRYLERIRTRLHRPSSHDTLEAIESAIAEITPILTVDFTRDNRAFSKAVMDVILNTAVNEADRPFGRIASFGGAGEFEDASGAVVRTLGYTIQLEP